MKTGSSKPGSNLTQHVIAAVVAVTLVLLAVSGKLGAKDFATGLLALLGTLAGALLAFRLEQTREASKEQRTQILALNRALFTLGTQLNEISTYLLNFNRYKTEGARAFNMPALQPIENFYIDQNIDDLAFLLATSHRNLVFDVLIEQQRFDQAMQAIKLRNAHYLSAVLPKLADQGMNKKIQTRETLRSALGELDFDTAVNQANEALRHLEASFLSIPPVMNKVYSAAKALFPSEIFIDVERLSDQEIEGTWQ